MEDEDLELLAEARGILSSYVEVDKLDEDLLICECMCISVRDIRETFKINGPSLDLLVSELGMGTACSTCLKSKEDWFNRI